MSHPTLFLSHGAPDLVLHPSPAQNFLKTLGKQIDQRSGRPKAILVISAHWLSQVPTVSTASQPRTIHDFGGFPPELYQMQYPAPGAPELAEQVVKLLHAAGLECATTPNRGLDHGAWSPLMLMYPDANIPVTQLSLQPYQSTAYHLQLGRALAPLRQDGVLIVSSGAITHNLGVFGSYAFDAAPAEWAVQFDRWMAETIEHNNIDALLDYRRLAPYASQNHPSEEHLLPLYVALGAAGTDEKGTPVKGRKLHNSFTYGAFSMAAYEFTTPDANLHN